MKQEEILKTFRTAICEELGLLGDEYLILNGSDKLRGRFSFAFIVFARLTKYHFKNFTARAIIRPYLHKIKFNRNEPSILDEKIWGYEMDEAEKEKYIRIAKKVSYMLSEQFMNDFLLYNGQLADILKAG